MPDRFPPLPTDFTFYLSPDMTTKCSGGVMSTQVMQPQKVFISIETVKSDSVVQFMVNENCPLYEEILINIGIGAGSNYIHSNTYLFGVGVCVKVINAFALPQRTC